MVVPSFFDGLMISLRLINVVVFDHGEWMRYGYIIIICNRGYVINLLWVTMQFDHARIVAGHSPEPELCYLLNIFCDFLERVFFLYVKTRLKDVNCWFDLIFASLRIPFKQRVFWLEDNQECHWKKISITTAVLYMNYMVEGFYN